MHLSIWNSGFGTGYAAKIDREEVRMRRAIKVQADATELAAVRRRIATNASSESG